MERKSLSITAVATLVAILCVLTTNVFSCSDHERKALIEFKNGLEDPQNRYSLWLRQNDCCQWQGIGCDRSTGAVTSIDFRNRYGFWNLSGEIMPSLLRLKSLNYLDLSSNTFDGSTVPYFLGLLENLQYLNLSDAGFSGPIPSSLGNLSRVEYLDFSSSSLSADNLEWLRGLTSLKYLSLNSVDLSGVGPNWLMIINDNLPNLTELHLANCGLTGLAMIPSPGFANLSSLVVLDLSFNDLASQFPGWILNMSKLAYIDMNNCGLYGRIPLGLGELPDLQVLILSGNMNLSGSCSQLFQGSWSKIEVLDFGSNRLRGRLPLSLGNMTSLMHFSPFANNVEGTIPSTIGSMCSLENFDLSGNNLTGNLPEYLLGTESCISNSTLPNLMYLRLRNNELNGHLPIWLGQLNNLVELSLDYNSLQGPIPASLGTLQNLTDLGLGGNELNGTVPVSLGELSKLSTLDLSSNHLTGVVSEQHFLRLSNLKILDLSENSLALNISSNWIPPFQVRVLFTGSCQLGPSVPAWLRSQKEVKFLDFSNTSISGLIPEWFWDISSNLSLLNMSLNQLTGELPDPLQVAPFADIDLSSNLFQGPIPLPIVEIELLDLSNNQLSGHIPPNIGKAMPNLIILSLESNQITGSIPDSIGEMLFLQVIDISSNNLSGSIPSSIGNCSILKALDLKNNNLSGKIPAALGQLVQLQSVHLSSNKLSGSLPQSLKNLSSLEVLDLGDNWLAGDVQQLVINGDFNKLRILRLRSNTFSGEIPPAISNLSSLQVLDLAANNFSGKIPSSFGSLRAMAQERDRNQYLFYGKYRGVYYEESLELNMKGRSLRYTKTLSLVTSIDLSLNDLSGQLPQEITKLSGLLVLNLSGNQISGPIPESISNMQQLSSLDLSRNRLSGTIPSSMSSSLTFLGYLNLSDNDLSGKIPFTGQMTTFSASSFSGNPNLCGDPLTIECPDGTQGGRAGGDDGRTHDHDEFIDQWFYLSVGVGFAAGLLVPFVLLQLRRSWSVAYFDFIDRITETLLISGSRKSLKVAARRNRRRSRG